MIFLFGARKESENAFIFQFVYGSSGTIEWPDGTTDTFSANIPEKYFDYDALPVQASSDGTKWVWITIRGTITGISHTVRPSSYTGAYYVPQIYEIYLKATDATSWGFATNNTTVLRNLEYLHWYGKCNVSSLSYFLAHTTGLRGCIFEDSSSVTNFSSFLYASGIQSNLKVDVSSATTLNSFLRACSGFNERLNINSSSFTNMAAAFQSLYSYAHELDLDLSSLTTDIGTTVIQNAYSLPSLRLRNMTSVVTSLTVVGSALSSTALATLFGDLYDRSSTTAGSITITNAAGAASLTSEQEAIASSKNWTIVS